LRTHPLFYDSLELIREISGGYLIRQMYQAKFGKDVNISNFRIMHVPFSYYPIRFVVYKNVTEDELKMIFLIMQMLKTYVSKKTLFREGLGIDTEEMDMFFMNAKVLNEKEKTKK